MTLRFRIEPTKKSGPRVAVVREIVQENGAVKTEQIGSFSARKNAHALLPKLRDERERYEFMNELNQLEFNKTHFNTNADKLGRLIIRLDEKVIEKLIDLSIQCCKQDIQFNPAYCMLNALLKGGAAAEAQLNKKLGKKTNFLESLNVRIPAVTLPKEIDSDLTKPFKALLKLNKSLEDICQDFTIIARYYHKTTSFKPDYFKHYAGVGESHNKIKPSKWCYGIAIELLHKYKVNPLSIISADKAAEYWGWLQKDILPAKKAVQAFITKFNVPDKNKNSIENGINKAYGFA